VSSYEPGAVVIAGTTLRAARASARAGGGRGTGTRVGRFLDAHLLEILIAVCLAALVVLILVSQVYPLKFPNPDFGWVVAIYALLVANLASFMRYAYRAFGGGDPDPKHDSWKNDPGGGPSGSHIILAVIATVLTVILLFTCLYYLYHAGLYMSIHPRSVAISWKTDILLAIGVLTTTQSPPMVLNGAGYAAAAQELTDLVLLGGVATVALSRL
jgi:phosphatidylglycerophosphate synthase